MAPERNPTPPRGAELPAANPMPPGTGAGAADGPRAAPPPPPPPNAVAARAAMAPWRNPRPVPVVRAGDTVYVPTSAQSDWRQFFDGLRDVVSILGIIAVLSAL